MKLHLVSLGCARNQVDSEIMLSRLQQAGIDICAAPEAAEVIVVNTCSFIEPAVNESIDTILELARFKEQGNCRRLIVAGCLPERYREEIAASMPEVDLFLGTGAFHLIVDAVEGTLDGPGCLLPDPNRQLLQIQDLPRRSTLPHTAYLKIAEGCSRQCTYCIIPTLRGRQRSRTPADICAEAEALLGGGVQELVLVAQDTTAYGRDLSPAADLAALLRSLTQIPTAAGRCAEAAGDDPARWIRLLYGHPESIRRAVLKTVAAHADICPYFDIPIQHASPSVLRNMGRRYAADDLCRLFDDIRSSVPDAALRTTVIVGFPGESDRDFDRLLELVETVRFDHLGVFVYSDAADLPSHRLPGHVPAAVAARRHDRLMRRQKEIAAQTNRRHLDRVYQVLVEEKPEERLFVGRTAFQAPEVDGLTYVQADDLRLGCFARVRISDVLDYDLVGTVV